MKKQFVSFLPSSLSVLLLGYMGLNMQIIRCIRFNFQIASDWLRLQFGVNLNSVKQVISRENDASLPFITWSLRVRYDVKHLHCTDAGTTFSTEPLVFLFVLLSVPSSRQPPLRHRPSLSPSVGMPGGSIRSSSLSPAVSLTPQSLRCHAIRLVCVIVSTGVAASCLG